MEITKMLAQFVTKKYFNDMPEKAIEVAKDHSLDCLGVIMLAGSSHLSGQI